jgi:hypothetical protein
MTTQLKRLQEQMKQDLFGATPEGCCVQCKDAFTSANVFTPAGARETRISGMCERCWDKMFKKGS